MTDLKEITMDGFIFDGDLHILRYIPEREENPYAYGFIFMNEEDKFVTNLYQDTFNAKELKVLNEVGEDSKMYLEESNTFEKAYDAFADFWLDNEIKRFVLIERWNETMVKKLEANTIYFVKCE